MSLFIRKKGGPYYIRIWVAGDKIIRSTGTTDRAAAKEFERAETERSWRELKLGDRSAVAWRTAAARWLEETRKKTKAKDEYMLAWFGQYLDTLALSAIDAEVIKDLREGLAEEGSSESNIDRYMALLRSVLRKCRDEWGYLGTIPKVPMFNPELVEPRWLTRAEFAALLRELPPHQKLAAAFAVLTGLRMRSMLQLTWTRVDLEHHRAWVPLGQMKKKRTFGFPLSLAARGVLRRCRRFAPRGDHVFQYCPVKGAFRPIDDCNTEAFKKAVVRAGLDPTEVDWHTLRHTFASWAIQSGVSLHELMQLGGWKSYAMVLRYAHLAPDHLAQAAELVSQNRSQGKRRSSRKAA